MIERTGFPALAPNGLDLPYAIRPRGVQLYSTAILYGLLVLIGLGVGAVLAVTVSKAAPGAYIGIAGPALIGLIGAVQLWRLYRPAVTLYADRIEKRNLFGPPQVLHRHEIKGVGPNISTRSGAYFEILPLTPASPINLPASARKDPAVAAWLQGAPDPDAEQRAAERAALLNDPRFGADPTQRRAALSRAKSVSVAFSVVCLALAAWAAFAVRPYALTLAAAAIAPFGGLVIVRVFNGLVLWMGASKVQPQVGLVSILPLLALALGQLTNDRLYDPFTLIGIAGVSGVVAGTAIFMFGERTALQRSYAIVGGLCVPGFHLTARSSAPGRTFRTTVRFKLAD